MYNLFFDEAASQDLEEAIHWYENKAMGLGERFLNEVHRLFSLIEINPYLFSKKKKEYRLAHVKTFPFVLVYKIDVEKDLVIIFRVFHTKRSHTKKFKKS